MRLIALKIDNTRKGYMIILLGILVIILGLMCSGGGSWYAMLFCALVGGGYIVWSGYLTIAMKKKMDAAELIETTTVRYRDEGEYLYIEIEDDPSETDGETPKSV